MPIRIYIGTEPKTEIACKVLQHSIISRTKAEVEFVEMIGPEWEYPTDGIKVGTGFSLRRWMIPKAQGWRGYALYLDADQIVLGDVDHLWSYIQSTSHYYQRPVAWTTWQPDKYYKSPAPQTSVMGLCCENAVGKWGFDIDRVIAHLRSSPDRDTYVRFMHATWLQAHPTGSASNYDAFDEKVSRYGPHPIPLPVEWNHLNVYEKGKTQLLHYTKEDDQPWYNPQHKFANLWQRELEAAMDAGLVTQDMIKAALANWGKKQDWRPTNGLHPYYKRYVK